ncbi:MAG: hypothetical protein AUJ52_10445 [Elusimicrobia bacterium CG1_02_63_36]|nr:MAG: hypothetical protein AUJ52_10445 [Elusimicrobia bacterium CG1_02_63_36]PIP82213.1 MAG: hypothetical protein COR54_16125 [Elusimicrobia bacterium CG22_combo_CG10-13_8_21_14_all_63_91]PJA12796.1 MAG: DUF1634 domain-containing protein [Elusimicrobia bacterium CG_4_10_14_0_2_um_filter_63_34]PJB23012.1 MAG: DUF1634 domain-containing protein [Elusimicrobia bacterium CG_4_9_14_3_um_filter_62_55]
MDSEFERRLGRLLLAGVLLSGGVILTGLALSRPGVVVLGINLLIATPIARVAVIGVRYALDREWRWAGLSGLVLAIIAASAALGLH